MKIDDGDFLTFASIANGLGVMPKPWILTLRACEVEPGVYRRHPQIGTRSRSDISRDGYMGVLFEATVGNSKDTISRIIKAGWKRWWKMGDRGTSDHINIWPLIPTLYMLRYGSWVPTLPTIIIDKSKYTTGFRAHLTALHIMTEMKIGKRRWSHRRTLKLLHKRNPNNPWFESLYVAAMGWSNENLEFVFSEEEAGYGWGGCPPEVFKALTLRAMAMGGN